MIVYYSMIAWIFAMYFIASVSNGAYHLDRAGNRRINYSMAFITMAYLVFFIGMRSGVGDTPAYIGRFKSLPTSIPGNFYTAFKKDRLFFAIGILFKGFISQNPQAWLMFIAIVSGYCVAKALADNSINFFFSMYLFIVMVQFVWMLNGIRQFIPVSILFANLKLMKERRIVPYMLLTLLLSQIHVTALIMIPAYFIGVSKPWRAQFWFLLAIIAVVGLSIDTIAARFSMYLEDGAYEGYLDAAANTAGSHILRTAVAAAPPILAFVCRRFVQTENDRVLDICVNFSTVAAILYFISSRSGGILIGRFPIYFDMYNLLLLPWLVEHCFKKSSKMIAMVGIGLCYFAFFYLKVTGMKMGYYSSALGISIR